MTHPLAVRIIDKHGREFPSIRACARAYGVNRLVVSYHLNTHGHLERLGTGQSRPGGNSAGKKVVFGNHSWPSVTAAANEIGISRTRLYRWLRPNASAAMRDMLMAAVMAWGEGRRAKAPARPATRDNATGGEA